MLIVMEPSITAPDENARRNGEAKARKKRLMIVAILFIFAGLPTLYFVGKYLLTPEWKRNHPPVWAHLADSKDSSWYINTGSVVLTPKGLMATVKEVSKEKPRHYTLWINFFNCTGMNIYNVYSRQDFENELPLSGPEYAPDYTSLQFISPGEISEVEQNAACWLEGKQVSHKPN